MSTEEQPCSRPAPMQEHAHWRCDCVPDLGPAHCHRCSRLAGTAVAWDDAPCAAFAEQAFAVTESVLAVVPALEGPALADEVMAQALDAFALRSAEPATAGGAPAAEPPARPVPGPPAPGPTPGARSEHVAPMPSAPLPKAPRERLVTGAEAHASKEPPHPWRLTNLAREQAESFGLTPREVTELAEAATVRHRAPRGGVNHYCGDLLVLVDETGECVISVVERDLVVLDEVRTDRPEALPRAKSGGPGRRAPSGTKDMLALLKEHGFEVRMGSKGHWLATHADHPGHQWSVPATPSDKRSLPNCVAQIKRDTGIDVTVRADGRA